MPDAVTIRAARDADADGLIALLGGVFAEYPGCVLDVDGEMPELRAIATTFAHARGGFWAVERAGEIVGCIGWTPTLHGDGVELRKLYVRADTRRTGLGTRLCALVDDVARSRRATFVELWSDTRFHDAHRLYARLGYVRSANTRLLHDKSDTEEFHFVRTLDATAVD